jgi:hypothetical protein
MRRATADDEKHHPKSGAFQQRRREFAPANAAPAGVAGRKCPAADLIAI